VIENKRSGEIIDSALAMISIISADGAKHFVSLGEMLILFLAALAHIRIQNETTGTRVIT
jgi:hypothetical protein